MLASEMQLEIEKLRTVPEESRLGSQDTVLHCRVIVYTPKGHRCEFSAHQPLLSWALTMPHSPSAGHRPGAVPHSMAPRMVFFFLVTVPYGLEKNVSYAVKQLAFFNMLLMC